MITFTINHEPYRTTAQQKRISVRSGTPRFYYPEKLQESFNAYLNEVWPYRPEEPLKGPLALHVTFCFGTADKRKQQTMKTTRPDTDNLIKGFKDVLTAAGYWHDDAQVCREIVEKKWTPTGSITVTIYSMYDAKKDAERMRREIDKI